MLDRIAPALAAFFHWQSILSLNGRPAVIFSGALNRALYKDTHMASIEEVLDSLDPPLKHGYRKDDDGLVLTLIDPGVPASVARRLTPRVLSDSALLQVILLYAVNEIRGKGSHVKLRVLPLVDSPEID